MRELANMTGMDCATNDAECMSMLLETSRGGMTHMEIDHFLTHRPDAHPGTLCMYVWPVQYSSDPKGKNCTMSNDCTHVSCSRSAILY